MRILVRLFFKLLIITGIIFFALWNHRFFSFYKGFSKSNYQDYSITTTLTSLNNIEKVEYYEKVVKSDESQYKVYILTTDDVYLLDASQDDIDAMQNLTIFNDNNKPRKFAPVPFYVETIIGFIILVIPFGRKKKA